MFSGTTTALITPFKKDGTVDEEALRRLVDFQEMGGVDALVPCGSTGEAATLTSEEHVKVIEIVVDQVRRAKILAGAGSNSTAEAINLSKRAENAGADGILSISPYYNKPTQDGIYKHFKTISEAVDIPLVIYNVPMRTSSNISAETTLKLAELPGIVATKEASGNLDQIQTIMDHKPDDFEVLSGDDGLTFAMMSMGCMGVISTSSNCVPSMVSSMVNLCLRKEFKRAVEINTELTPLFSVLFCETNPIPIKYVMSRMGYGSGLLRLPLTEITEPNRASVDAVLTKLGIL